MSICDEACANSYSWGLKAVNYFRKKKPSDVRLGSKYTSDIQTFERKTQQKFVSCQNKILAKSFFQRNLLICSIYMSLLKVTFFVHSYFLWSPNWNVLQRYLYSNIKFFLCSFISTCILNKVTLRYKHQRQCAQEFSTVSLTDNMSVIYCNSPEGKAFWKCIHLFKTYFGKTCVWLVRMKSVLPEITMVSNNRVIN